MWDTGHGIQDAEHGTLDTGYKPLDNNKTNTA